MKRLSAALFSLDILCQDERQLSLYCYRYISLILLRRIWLGSKLLCDRPINYLPIYCNLL